MKKNNILISFILIVLFWSCSENDKMDFNDENASIYFQLTEDKFKENLDSISYSFAFNDLDKDTVFIPVKIMGNTVNYDRFFDVEIIDSLTTAKPEIHYEALKSSFFKIPAGSIFGEIPVVLSSSDTALNDSVFYISLQLLESEDFRLGAKEKVSVKLSFTNRLVQPIIWSSVLKYFFGSYNRKKHEVFYQLFERDFPEDRMVIYPEYGLWQTYGKLTSKYFSDNYPVYDDEGVVVEPW